MTAPSPQLYRTGTDTEQQPEKNKIMKERHFSPTLPSSLLSSLSFFHSLPFFDPAREYGEYCMVSARSAKAPAA